MSSENECTVNGVRYVAVERDDGECGECAFEHSACPQGPQPRCVSWRRTDGRSIIWQPAPSSWSTTPPTRDGWWWWRSTPKSGPRPVEIYNGYADETDSLPAEMGGEWKEMEQP